MANISHNSTTQYEETKRLIDTHHDKINKDKTEDNLRQENSIKHVPEDLKNTRSSNITASEVEDAVNAHPVQISNASPEETEHQASKESALEFTDQVTNEPALEETGQVTEASLEVKERSANSPTSQVTNLVINSPENIRATDVPHKITPEVPGSHVTNVPTRTAIDVPESQATNAPNKTSTDVPESQATGVSHKTSTDVPESQATGVSHKTATDAPESQATDAAKETVTDVPDSQATDVSNKTAPETVDNGRKQAEENNSHDRKGGKKYKNKNGGISSEEFDQYPIPFAAFWISEVPNSIFEQVYSGWTKDEVQEMKRIWRSIKDKRDEIAHTIPKQLKVDRNLFYLFVKALEECKFLTSEDDTRISLELFDLLKYSKSIYFTIPLISVS